LDRPDFLVQAVLSVEPYRFRWVDSALRLDGRRSCGRHRRLAVKREAGSVGVKFYIFLIPRIQRKERE
jgi:hypothetical protein